VKNFLKDHRCTPLRDENPKPADLPPGNLPDGKSSSGARIAAKSTRKQGGNRDPILHVGAFASTGLRLQVAEKYREMVGLDFKLLQILASCGVEKPWDARRDEVVQAGRLREFESTPSG
jgi:hypothetical protein